MEKHVGLNPAWFEPGADGVSPFERLSATVGFGAAGTAAAFRALIAQDAAQEPSALQVGDVVRLERYEDGMDGWAFFTSESHLVGTEHTISDIDGDGAAYVAGTYWPLSALTLVRRAGDATPVDADAKDAEIARLTAEVERWHDYWVIASTQRDAARAEVERWKSIAEAHEQNYRAMLRRVDEVAAERDALRARIDAGVRAWEKWKQQCGSLWLWAFPGATASQAWSDVCDALDADYVVYPIADHISDPGKMADERKGERRVVNIITPYFRRQNYFRDRRRTAGTRADRKGN